MAYKSLYSSVMVEWNKPLYIPIPVSKHSKYTLCPMIPKYSNIKIATRFEAIVN